MVRPIGIAALVGSTIVFVVGVLTLVALISVARAAPTCEASKAVSTGTLCAIKPSRTDPYTTNGFGDHVVGFPNNPTKGIWVHMTGTGGKPYFPRSERFLNDVWDTELMGQGYIVLDISYDNIESVSESCSTDQGRGIDNCSGNIRLEVLTGADVSPLRNTNSINSVEHRVAALIDYLAANGVDLPAGSAPFVDWTTISVSGHSQGAGMAYYLAKYFGVQFACFLGGPYDVADYVPNKPAREKNFADWYLDTSVNETLFGRMGALLTTADKSYRGFTFAYALLGLVKDQQWFEADKPAYTDAQGKAISGHAAAVQDPALASLRAQACFR